MKLKVCAGKGLNCSQAPLITRQDNLDKTLPMSTFSTGWYLIYTRPKQEKNLVTRLEEIRIRSYLPVSRIIRQWHDRKKMVDVPLFSSYVFVYLSGLKDYFECSKRQGFIKFVSFGGQPAKVNQSTIDNIKILTGCGVPLEINSQTYQLGQQLMIAEGIFAGMKCELIDYQGKRKVLVRVHELNRNIIIDPTLNSLVSMNLAGSYG